VAARPRRLTVVLTDRHLQALAGLVLLGAVLRFATLDARSFWLDEAVTLQLIERELSDLIEVTTNAQTTPPLYYLLAWAWAKLFGVGEVGLRSLTALAGTATIPVAWAAARRLGTPRAGLVAAALAATSPLLIWQSQDARPYALLVLLSGLSFVLFLRAKDRPGGDRLAWWAVASVAAVATHYFAAFPVAVEALWLLTAGRGRRATAMAVAGTALATGALGLAAVRIQSGGAAGWIENLDLGGRLLQVPAQYLVGFQPPFQRTSAALAGVLVLVAAWLVVTRTDRWERRGAVLALTVGGAAIVVPAVLALAGLDYLITRNVAAGWVPLAAVAAVGLGARRGGRLGAATAVALCTVFAAIAVSTAWEPKFERDDWRGVAQAIGAAGAHDRAILISPSLGLDALRLYRPEARPMPFGGARVSEVVVLGLPPRHREVGEAPEPPRPDRAVRPERGFRLVDRIDGETFTLLRFRAKRPHRLTPFQLAGSRLAPHSESLFEPSSVNAPPPVYGRRATPPAATPSPRRPRTQGGRAGP
jgi:hypothetical protein